MASIETLPAPFPLYIAKLLPDLKSLDAIRRASPLFAAVFTAHAAELVEHLMQNTLLEDVSVEIRAHILLLTEGNTPQSPEELESLYAKARNNLPRSTSAIVISKVLRKFTLSHSLVTEIFEMKLSRIRSLPHEHIKDKNFRYANSRSTPHQELRGIPYHLPDPSPPYWTEEQRLFRGLWRLKTYRILGCPKHFPALVLTGDKRQDWAADEIEDVNECIRMLRNADTSADHVRTPVWRALAPIPTSSGLPNYISREWPVNVEDSIRCLQRCSLACRWFHGPCLRIYFSPLLDADWRVFRRLGLGIWADRRVKEEFELMGWPIAPEVVLQYGQPLKFGNPPRARQDDAFFTWKSLYEAAVARWGSPS